MKIASLVLSGLLAATIFGPASAIAAEKGAGVTASQADEFSASKKRRHYVHSYVDPYSSVIVQPYQPIYATPSHDFIGGHDGYPGEYAARKAYGQCVHDLGYGRWKGC